MALRTFTAPMLAALALIVLTPVTGSVPASASTPAGGAAAGSARASASTASAASATVRTYDVGDTAIP
ncbi:MAG: hypothetical protein AB7G37_13840, partial [Solirubrobacteraceae bacterium]